MEICDRCRKECPVTWAIRGPVSIELVCVACKPRPKPRNSRVAEPLRQDAADPEEQSITVAIGNERERCAKICDEGALKYEGDVAAILMTTADLIRNPIELDSWARGSI